MNEKLQIFVLELLFHKRLTRKEIFKLKPKLFCNNDDFFKTVKILKEFDYIQVRNYNKNRVYYSLTLNGWCFANILALQPNTNKKYRQIAKEIIWLP